MLMMRPRSGGLMLLIPQYLDLASFEKRTTHTCTSSSKRFQLFIRLNLYAMPSGLAECRPGLVAWATLRSSAMDEVHLTSHAGRHCQAPAEAHLNTLSQAAMSALSWCVKGPFPTRAM